MTVSAVCPVSCNLGTSSLTGLRARKSRDARQEGQKGA
jgi:hypothetical protein